MTTHITGPLLRHDDHLNKLRRLPVGINPDYVVYFNDFLNPDDYNTTNFTATTVDGDSDAAQVYAVQTGIKNGELKLTTNDKSADSNSIQLKVENHKLQDGKILAFEAYLELSAVTTVDMFIGLAITDGSPLDASDFIGFKIADGSAAILCKNAKNSTETSTSSGVSAAANTKVKLSFCADGIGSISYFVNDNLVATHITNICDDEELALTAHLKTNSAAAKSMNIDYVLIAQER